MQILKPVFSALFLMLLAAPQSIAQQASQPMPNPKASPYYMAAVLQGAFKTDPLPIGVLAGGHFSAIGLANNCVGNLTSERPDATINFRSVKGPVTLYVAASTDTALVVHTPAGQWICADDSEGGGINPELKLDQPGDGTYAVWVAAVETPDQPVPAVLVVSEFPPVW